MEESPPALARHPEFRRRRGVTDREAAASALQRFHAAYSDLTDAELQRLAPGATPTDPNSYSTITPAKLALFDALGIASPFDYLDLLLVLGWDYVRIAQHLGITPALISMWKSGRRPVAAHHVERLGALVYDQLLLHRRRIQADADHAQAQAARQDPPTPNPAPAILAAFDRQLTLWAQGVMQQTNTLNATLIRCCQSLARYADRDPDTAKILPQERREMAYAAAQIRFYVAYLDGLTQEEGEA